MLRKIGLILIIILGLFGVLIFDYIYYPMMDFKAKESAQNYLQSTYKEEFVIKDVTYSKALEDKSGLYYVTARPKDGRLIDIQLYVSQDFQKVSDDYKEGKWRYELNQVYLPFLQNVYGTGFSHAVNVTIPEEAMKKFDIRTPYATIYDHFHSQSSEFLFASIYSDDKFDPSKELEKVDKVLAYIRARHLQDFSLNIRYYPASFHKTLSEQELALTPFDFARKYGKEISYTFRLDSRDEKTQELLPKVHSPQDLAPFLIKIK